MRVTLCFAALLGLYAGCGGSAPPDAGGMDAGVDSGRVLRDAGPICEPGCAPSERCCGGEDGASCLPVLDDVNNCGACGFDCVAEERGDSCAQGDCVCGRAMLGCLGTRQSLCCPPREPGGEAYCADLDRDASDCGGCGDVCPFGRSDRCTGGMCVCGQMREPCDVGETCCDIGAAVVECLDLTTNDDHCGACNAGCLLAETCRESTCTRGETACDGGCEEGAICCNGECCIRTQCGDDGCML